MKQYRKKTGRKLKRPDKKIFDLLYYEEQRSAEDIAKMYGVTVSTIYNWACIYRKED